MSSQYGELRLTSGCDRLAGLGHPGKFQPVSRLGSVTARHSSIVHGLQPNYAAMNRGRHLYSAGRPSRWASAHSLVPHEMVAVRQAVVLGMVTTEGALHGCTSSGTEISL